jgi:hypothetical protein
MEEIDPAVLLAIQDRLDGIRDWIALEAPYVISDRDNPDSSAPEQEYWHSGYQAALRDVLVLIRGLYGTSEKPTGGDIP